MQAASTHLRPVPEVRAPHQPLLWALCAGLLVPAVLMMVSSLRALRLQGDTTYPESEIVYLAQSAARTGQLYRPLAQPPYSPAPYGPALYLALAGVGRGAGLSLDGLEFAGRALVLAGFLALGVLIGAWVKQLTGSRLAALTALLFVLAQPDAFPWQVTVRPDVPALLFSCCGLCLCAVSRGRRWKLAAAGLCFGAAVLTKQSFLAAPLAAAIAFALERRWKDLAWVAGSAVLLAAAALAALMLRGEAVISNLFLLRHSDTELLGALGLVKDELLAFDMRWLLLPLALAGAAQCWRSRSLSHRLLAIYFALAWLQSLPLLLHIGSNYNILLEPWVASAMLAAVAVNKVAASGRIPGGAALALAGGLLLAHGIYRAVRPPGPDTLLDFSSLRRVVAGRRVLTDNSYLAARSADPVMLDAYFNHILEENGRWDSGPIREQLERGDFDLVLLTVHGRFLRRWRGLVFFSPAMLKQIGNTYRLVCHTPLQAGYSRTAVWIPKSEVLGGELQKQLQEAGCR